jgi:hypothetical protein
LTVDEEAQFYRVVDATARRLWALNVVNPTLAAPYDVLNQATGGLKWRVTQAEPALAVSTLDAAHHQAPSDTEQTMTAHLRPRPVTNTTGLNPLVTVLADRCILWIPDNA